MTGPSEQAQEERSLGGPSDPPNPQEAPSEAPQSHRVNPLSGQEEALAGPHPMGLMAHRGQHTPMQASCMHRSLVSWSPGLPSTVAFWMGTRLLAARAVRCSKLWIVLHVIAPSH